MTVQELDLMDARAFVDGIPYDYFARLRRMPGLPKAVDAEGYEFWYLVRHADVVAASKDGEVFRSGPSTMTSVRQGSKGLPLITFLDGQEHARLRKQVFRGFTPARLARMEEPLAALVDRILAAVSAKDEFDLAEEVALRLPLEVLAELIGVPHEDRPEIIEWTRHTMNVGDPDYHHSTPEKAANAFRELMGYFHALAAARADRPADDLFSVLASGHGQPGGLTLEEIALFGTTLVGASETTYCSVSGGVLALLRHPEQLALLRADRTLIPAAVEEIIRYVTPATHFARQVARDTEVAGQPIRAGERVVLWYTSANRDENVFEDPDRFDVTRRPNPHVSFGGGGPHVCIGRALAGIELRLFLDAVLDRLPDLELTGEPVRSATNSMNAFRSIPARFR
jgi:cholest-4-en-3-one 26-monooxygenase